MPSHAVASHSRPSEPQRELEQEGGEEVNEAQEGMRRRGTKITSDLPLERKRARDRKAQTALRQKRNAYIKSLEARLVFYEENQHDGRVRKLASLVVKLREENGHLRAQLSRLKTFLSELDSVAETELSSTLYENIKSLRNVRPGTAVPQQDDGEPSALENSELNIQSPTVGLQTESPPPSLSLAQECPGFDPPASHRPLLHASPSLSDDQNAMEPGNFPTHLETPGRMLEFGLSPSLLDPMKGLLDFPDEQGVPSRVENHTIPQDLPHHANLFSYLDYFDMQSNNVLGSETLQTSHPTASLIENQLPAYVDGCAMDGRSNFGLKNFTGIERWPTHLDYTPSGAKWAQLPVITYSNPDVHLDYVQTWILKADKELIASFPDMPDAGDLLYGSRTNLLADIIAKQIQQWSEREAERVAISYLIYMYTLWRLSPTRERYYRIPEFFRPTDDQLNQPHNPSFDWLLWPKLRSNFIKIGRNLSRVALTEVFRVFARSLRVRWGNDTVLERTPEGGLRMRGSFHELITSQEGWALGLDFIQRYPELVDGLELSRMLYSTW